MHCLALSLAFLLRSKHLLISRLQSSSSVILEPKKMKSLTVSPCICHEVMGPDAMILAFWMLSFKPAVSLSSFTFIKRLFSSSSLSSIRVVSSAYLRLLVFFLAFLIPAWWCRSTKIAIPKCLFGMHSTSSWRKSRPKRLRKKYWTSP